MKNYHDFRSGYKINSSLFTKNVLTRWLKLRDPCIQQKKAASGATNTQSGKQTQ